MKIAISSKMADYKQEDIVKEHLVHLPIGQRRRSGEGNPTRARAGMHGQPTDSRSLSAGFAAAVHGVLHVLLELVGRVVLQLGKIRPRRNRCRPRRLCLRLGLRIGWNGRRRLAR